MPSSHYIDGLSDEEVEEAEGEKHPEAENRCENEAEVGDEEEEKVKESKAIGCEDVDLEMAVERRITLGENGISDPKYFYRYSFAIQPQLYLAKLTDDPFYCNNKPDLRRYLAM